MPKENKTLSKSAQRVQNAINIESLTHDKIIAIK